MQRFNLAHKMWIEENKKLTGAMIGKRSSDSCWNRSIEYSWTISPKHFNAAILYVRFSFLHSLYTESNTWRKETNSSFLSCWHLIILFTYQPCKKKKNRKKGPWGKVYLSVLHYRKRECVITNETPIKFVPQSGFSSARYSNRGQ